MKAQHRDSPSVFDVRIDLAIGVFIGDHLAAPIEPDEGSIIAAHVLLELHPVTAAGQPLESRRGTVPRHLLAAAELDVVAPRKSKLAGVLLLVEPPRNVQLMAVGGVFVERRQALEQRYLSADAAADGVHQVSTDLAAGIRQSIRKRRALGVEQNADRFTGARGQYHDPCGDVPARPARAIDEAHTVRAAVATERHLVRHRVGRDIQVPGRECGRQMHRRRLIVRADRATAPARRRPEAGCAAAHVLGEDPLSVRIARMQARRRISVIQRLSQHRAMTGYRRYP